MSELQLHDIDLGRPMGQEGIERQLREDGDQDVVRAILQRIRNDAMGYNAEGHDELSDGNDNRAKLKFGASQGLQTLFWELVKLTPYAAEYLASESLNQSD